MPSPWVLRSMDPERTQEPLRQAMSKRYMKMNVLCKYFADNTCSRGKTCRFAHSASLMSYRPNPPVTRLARGFGEPVAQGEADFKSQRGPSASPISDSGPTATMDSGTDSSGSQKGSAKLDPSSSASTGVSSKAFRIGKSTVTAHGPARGKNPKPRVQSSALCRDFQLGKCKWADQCMYLHESGTIMEACCYWKAQGRCRYGANCKFLHEDPEPPPRPWTLPHRVVWDL